MRIDELKRIAEENGYEFYNGYVRIEISRRIGDSDCKNEIVINKYSLNELWISIVDCQDNDLKVIKAAIEFAETPIPDREEEKKFYLKHRWIFNKDFYMYLQKTSYDEKKMSVRSLDFSDGNDIKFTLKEIEKIKKKFDTDLKDFELVEVVDE